MSNPLQDPLKDAPAPKAEMPIEPAPAPGEPPRRSLEELQLFANSDQLVDDRFCKADKMAIFEMRQNKRI